MCRECGKEWRSWYHKASSTAHAAAAHPGLVGVIHDRLPQLKGNLAAARQQYIAAVTL